MINYNHRGVTYLYCVESAIKPQTASTLNWRDTKIVENVLRSYCWLLALFCL